MKPFSVPEAHNRKGIHSKEIVIEIHIELNEPWNTIWRWVFQIILSLFRWQINKGINQSVKLSQWEGTKLIWLAMDGTWKWISDWFGEISEQ